VGFFEQARLDRLFGRFVGPDDPRERRREPGSERADVALAAVAWENFQRALAPDHEDRVQLARARLMAEERASELFGCGIVAMPEPAAPDPWHEGTVDLVVPITVLVTPTAFVLVREGIPGVDDEPLVEAGRFRRDAFVDATVVDVSGRTVAEPSEETFEPARPVRLAIRWESGDGMDEDRFAFRSAWVAAEAARRFRRAAVGSG